MKVRIYIVVAAALSLAACGTPGAPRPPSLRLPETVRDLAASRQGNAVTLTWTEPQRTTDGENIRALGPTLVCMGVNDFPMTHCAQVAADLSQSQYAQCAPKVGQAVSCAVTLPLEVQIENRLGQATYAIEVLNQNGRSAGLSNQVRVPMAVALPAASHVGVMIQSDAVVIEFAGVQISAQYHVFRSSEGTGKPVDIGVGTPAAMINPGTRYGDTVAFRAEDRSFEWEKTYLYQIVGITTVSLPDGSIVDVMGDPTPEVKVFAHDVFPPAAPVGVQAVASGVGQQPFVDLTWAPNTESDLAGYNVYRHEEGQPAVKINAELAKAPSYRDANVQRGKKYFYSVSAIDLRNNESSKSGETSETVH
jgi:virulence-associated protein VagC